MKKFFRKILIPAACVIISLIVISVILEILFRLLFPMVPGVIEYNPHYGWTPIPNVNGIFRDRGALWSSEYAAFISTNEFGARTRYPPVPEPGADCLVLLGDSFVFGWGISDENLFSKKLEYLLNESSGGGADEAYRVINLGMIGFGPDQTLLLWKDVGRLYAPRTVLFFMTLGNDFTDIMSRFSVSNMALKPYFKPIDHTYQIYGLPVPYQLRWRLKHLIRASHLVYFLTWRMRRFSILNEDDIPRTRKPTRFNLKGEKFRRMDFILRRLKSSITNSKAEFGIVAIPTRNQWLRRKEADSPYDIAELQFLHEWCRSNDVSLLDLLDIDQYLEAPSLYYEKDGHWNLDAQEVIATILKDWIVDEFNNPEQKQ